jgi:malonyl-CoA O-methyltransferase
LSESFPAVDRAAARRRFERAAATYAGASRLEGEVAVRMVERLDYVKIAPRRVLDAGSGPWRDSRTLSKRYAEAEVLALDFSLGMLRAGRRALDLFARTPRLLCGDLAALPLADGSIDLVWSNLSLQWAGDSPAVLREFHRVLAPGGLVMFSSLGPDTLKELRAAAGGSRVHAFVDMHDLGDMLVAAGFNAPVMDMEMLTLAYAHGEGLLEDLRASGQTSARTDRPRGLAGKGLRARLRAQLPREASFEVVYGHGWKPSGSGAQDAKTIRVFKRMP